MALELDARRVAMLAEMGVRVWLPAARPVASPAPAAEAVASDPPPAAGGEAPPVAGPRSDTWWVVGDGPDSFSGDAGILLDRMLAAVGRSRAGAGSKGARIEQATSKGADQPVGAQDVSAGRERLRHAVLLQPPAVILAVGRHAAAALLDSTGPLGKLRGQRHEFEGVPVVVTYPVQHLIRHPLDKRRAWQDLCTAMQLSSTQLASTDALSRISALKSS